MLAQTGVVVVVDSSLIRVVADGVTVLLCHNFAAKEQEKNLASMEVDGNLWDFPEPLPARKRIRHDLEECMKRVQISPISSGQIRLQNDVSLYQKAAISTANSFAQVKIDPKNPLQLFIEINHTHQRYVLTCDKKYPHKPPQLVQLASKHPVQLAVLYNWLPVYSISDVLRELGDGGRI